MRPCSFAVAVAAAISFFLLPACSADKPLAAGESNQAPDPSASTTAAADGQNTLSGTYETDPIPVGRMAKVARNAGFERADIEEYLAGLRDVRNVVYTIKLTDAFWVAFESRDGGTAADVWAGPYEVIDGSTVRAGKAPCGPITYDYTLDAEVLSLTMTDNQCVGSDGKVPAGELIAQTTIYQSAPYHRIG